MNYQLVALFLISGIWACQERAENDHFSRKINQLAQRYEQLGRFSGTILIAEGQNIQFHQSFGLADYEFATPFTDTSIFKIGELTELFTNQLDTNQLAEKDIPAYVEEYCSKKGLKHTFYPPKDSSTVTGYLYHPVAEKGLILEKAQNYEEKKENFWQVGLQSTALDLFKYTLNLPEESISKSGYLEGDGFSFALQKTNNFIIIILSNRRHPVGAEMAASIQAIYHYQPYKLPLSRIPFDANTNFYDDYTGKYAINSNFQFEVITRNDSLFTILNGQETPTVPQSNNQFYYQDFDAAIRFIRDTNQVVTNAILLNGFLTGVTAQKVK